jgi:hypothetical protein
MGEICDEQNEENARRMQHPDQKDALAGRVVSHIGDVHKGSARHNQMLIDRIKGVPAMPATAESEADPCKPFSRRSDNRATLAQPVPRP